MTSTVFQDFITPVPASWLNDVNTSTYTTVPAEIARATAAENARPTSATLAAAGGASLIGNTPAGNIASTTVQAALNELDAEKALLAGSVSQTFSVATATAAGHAMRKDQTVDLTTAQSIAGVKTFSDVTNSTSPTTGGVVVSGGLGIAGDVNIGLGLTVLRSLTIGTANSYPHTVNGSTTFNNGIVAHGGATGIAETTDFSGAAGAATGWESDYRGTNGTTGWHAYFTTFNGTTQVSAGSITSTGTTTSYTTTSDYRLKTNVLPVTGAMARVKQLRPVTYTWVGSTTKGEGFIAHELQAICPTAVIGNKDDVDANGNPKYQSIDTSHVVPLLTAALQELKAEFDAYKLTHP